MNEGENSEWTLLTNVTSKNSSLRYQKSFMKQTTNNIHLVTSSDSLTSWNSYDCNDARIECIEILQHKTEIMWFIQMKQALYWVSIEIKSTLHERRMKNEIQCAVCYDSSYASSLMTMLITMLMTILRAIVDRSSLEHRLVSKSILFRVSLCSFESYR